jgi:hypothetical protein
MNEHTTAKTIRQNQNKTLTYSNTLTSFFKIINWTSNDDAVALGFTGDAIAIWEMNARSSLFHHTVNVLPRSANQM